MFNTKSVSDTSWKNDHYMTSDQLDYFREKLLTLKAELIGTTRKSLMKMKESDSRPIEEMERSVLAFDREMEIRNQTRNWNLVRRIDDALEQIEAGTYGYCQETEEPIGVERLEANPVSVFCLAVQEKYEMVSGRSRENIY